jgi:Zn finger protein HypA/HybF involved in hydrogenase expression
MSLNTNSSKYDPRFASFKIRTECPECAHPVPLNEPQLEVHCSTCLSDFKLAPSVWGKIFEHFEKNHLRLMSSDTHREFDFQGRKVILDMEIKTPACEKCHKQFPAELITTNIDSTFNCPSCGDSATIFSSPEWLHQYCNTASKIISTDEIHRDQKGIPLKPEDDEVAIALACPQCGGALKIDSKSERLYPCDFCKMEIYLPDAIWKKLHPVKKMKDFYVRFNGASIAMRDQETGERRKLEKQEQEDQYKQELLSIQEKNDEDEQQILDEIEVATLKSKRFQSITWIFMGLYFVLFLFLYVFMAVTPESNKKLPIILGSLGIVSIFILFLIILTFSKAKKIMKLRGVYVHECGWDLIETIIYYVPLLYFGYEYINCKMDVMDIKTGQFVKTHKDTAIQMGWALIILGLYIFILMGGILGFLALILKR